MEVFLSRQWQRSMPFFVLRDKKNIAKSLAVSRILLIFAVRVGADGKERLR